MTYAPVPSQAKTRGTGVSRHAEFIFALRFTRRDCQMRQLTNTPDSSVTFLSRSGVTLRCSAQVACPGSTHPPRLPDAPPAQHPCLKRDISVPLRCRAQDPFRCPSPRRTLRLPARPSDVLLVPKYRRAFNRRLKAIESSDELLIGANLALNGCFSRELWLNRNSRILTT